MKLLEIKDNQGYYRDEQGNFAVIDKITKEDILRLVDCVFDEEDIVFDDYKAESLGNKAHQIIYKDVLKKLQELRNRRQEFIDESDRLYLKEYIRFRDELAQQEN